MDASPAARRVTFAAIVCALVALGAYVLGPIAHRGGTPGRTPSAARSRPSARLPSGAPAAHVAAGEASIYQWLPFTAAGLAAAARVVVEFGDAYGTYSYTESGRAYGAQLVPVTSSQLVGQIESAYEAPGVAVARQAGRQVAVGTTTIRSIRTFGPGSLTFVVEVAQHLTGVSGSSKQVSDYAVTVSGSGMTWQVSDIELAAAGNS